MERNFSLRCTMPLQLDEGAALGLLQHLDKEELQNILDDESKLMEIVDDLPQIKNVKSDQETLMTSNKSLADYNLTVEPQLLVSKAKLSEVYESGTKLQQEYNENKQKLNYASDKQSLDATLAVLQTETAKSEESSDIIAESWLEGEIEMDDFIEQYIEKRTEVHSRRVKIDKMTEILRDRIRGTSTANGYSYPY